MRRHRYRGLAGGALAMLTLTLGLSRVLSGQSMEWTATGGSSGPQLRPAVAEPRASPAVVQHPLTLTPLEPTSLSRTHSTSSLVLPPLPDSTPDAHPHRLRNVLIGTAAGGVLGATLGARAGARSDRAQCIPECGGPPLNGLVEGIAYGLLGMVAGGVVGYVWP